MTCSRCLTNVALRLGRRAHLRQTSRRVLWDRSTGVTSSHRAPAGLHLLFSTPHRVMPPRALSVSLFETARPSSTLTSQLGILSSPINAAFRACSAPPAPLFRAAPLLHRPAPSPTPPTPLAASSASRTSQVCCCSTWLDAELGIGHVQATHGLEESLRVQIFSRRHTVGKTEL